MRLYMKIVHTSDLHLGKILYEFNMIKDQQHILKQIIQLVRIEKADALILAGDIYDRKVPSKEAVLLLDSFLTELISIPVDVYIAAGNHDSPERLGFASTLLKKQHLYIAGIYENEPVKITKYDKYGAVHFYLLPFAAKEVMSYYYKLEGEMRTYETCIAAAIKQMQVNTEERNILITHHFITDAGKEPILSESETIISIGGAEQIDVSYFSDFDYTALGHIHRSQQIGKKAIYYSGSPLAYSFSESGQKKSVLIVELLEKGIVNVKRKLLQPLHEMRIIKGKLQQIMEQENEQKRDDYLQVRLIDEEELLNPIGKLRQIYPNIMQLIIEKRERDDSSIAIRNEIKKKDILQLYKEFFKQVTGREFEEKREQAFIQILEEISQGDCQ